MYRRSRMGSRTSSGWLPSAGFTAGTRHGSAHPCAGMRGVEVNRDVLPLLAKSKTPTETMQHMVREPWGVKNHLLPTGNRPGGRFTGTICDAPTPPITPRWSTDSPNSATRPGSTYKSKSGTHPTTRTPRAVTSPSSPRPSFSPRARTGVVRVVSRWVPSPSSRQTASGRCIKT